jgi:adenosine deaminase
VCQLEPRPGENGSYHRSVFPNLHCHLDGSVRSATLAELAAVSGRSVPDDLLFTPRMGLEAALARFAFTLSLLAEPETVMRVAREICEDAVADGVTTLEIRFAPQLHTGGAIEAIVDAAVSGIASGPLRAGLVLCGLYGEPLDLVLRLVDVARTRPGVVGIDLARGPSPIHTVRLEDYAPAFRRAADLGLGRTVHAGEGRPPSEIRTAVETLLAQRIGHGTTLLEDERVADLVIERGVVIEACPTSNVHTGVIASVADHPLPRWLARGVVACVNPDNTLLSDVRASQEHERVRAIPGMTQALIDQVVRAGHRAAFRR